MNRFFLLISALILLNAESAARSAEPAPNVVLIISDDQAYTDFGFMGHSEVRTPHLDRLAARSARYVNGYVPSSVCRPSLVTLLTGLYPHQHGVYFNHPPPGNAAFNKMSKDEYVRTRDRSSYLIRAVPTLPRLLGRKGYVSFQTGKFWEGNFRNAGFTEGMTLDRASEPPAFGNRKLPDGSVVAHGNGDAGLAIGRVTMKPIDDFLDKHAGQPFLLWYAPFLPHEPHDAPEKFRKLYLGNPAVPRHEVDYFASCSQFDATVGRLVGGIERRGLAGRTLFVFVVDNGWGPLTRRSARTGKYPVDTRTKRSPFDRGLRTPILIRWDGHVKPATHTALCSSIDIVPTILHAVGMGEAAAKLPGVNLLPSAVGDVELKSRPVFGEIYPGDATSLGHPSRDVAYRWVREGRWKLIVPHRQRGAVWRNYVTGPSLFDVTADPLEEHNLAGDPQYGAEVARLRKLLDEWWTPGDDSAVAKPAE